MNCKLSSVREFKHMLEKGQQDAHIFSLVYSS